MKATIEVPDELYRRVKAKSAREGRAVHEVTWSSTSAMSDKARRPSPARLGRLDIRWRDEQSRPGSGLSEKPRVP
jgi:hypothetical protein